MKGRMSWLCDTLFGDQAGGTKEVGNHKLPPDGSKVAKVCASAVMSIREDSVPGA